MKPTLLNCGLAQLAQGAAVCTVPAAAPAAEQKPNILVCMLRGPSVS
jgi:hypothetical protein